MQNHQVMTWISEAERLIRAGQYGEANGRLDQVLQSNPGEPDALFLKGIAARRQGQLDIAISLFKKALVRTNNPAQVRNALGSAYFAKQDNAGALREYDKVLSLEPGHGDALYNSCLALIELDRASDVINRVAQRTKAKNADKRFCYIHAKALAAIGEEQAAEALYKKALGLDPVYFQALYGLGKLYRETGKAGEAIKYLKQAAKVGKGQVEPWYVLGNAYYDEGDFEQADHHYRTALAVNPVHTPTHISLNKLYWQFERSDVFGKSFELGLKVAPGYEPLRVAQIQALEKAQLYQDAAEALDQAFQNVGETPDLLRLGGRIMAATGFEEKALQYFDQALKHIGKLIGKVAEGPAVDLRLDYARVLIQTGHYSRASQELDIIQAEVPDNQQAWAYRGTCWRLLGDLEKYRWLNDYDRFVGPVRLEPPKGYASLSEFLKRLEERLLLLHKTTKAPIDQTLRGGTQTIGRLLDNQDPVIQEFKAALTRAVGVYLSGLPEDETHPLLSRKTESFDFSASWSVRLGSGGFHVNHVHPMGWISSAFYVAIDEGVLSDGENSHEGWIKFGESGLDLGPEREEIGRIVKPEPGLLVLFPSYMWHGTFPFQENAYRMTAPFDVVPSS